MKPAKKLENLINGWIPEPIAISPVTNRGPWHPSFHTIAGVEPAMVPEVKEEVEEFGGTVQFERNVLGKVDICIEL
jgi:hypothetical protein